MSMTSHLVHPPGVAAHDRGRGLDVADGIRALPGECGASGQPRHENAAPAGAKPRASLPGRPYMAASRPRQPPARPGGEPQERSDKLLPKCVVMTCWRECGCICRWDGRSQCVRDRSAGRTSANGAVMGDEPDSRCGLAEARIWLICASCAVGRMLRHQQSPGEDSVAGGRAAPIDS
jgi:hypothetical protein